MGTTEESKQARLQDYLLHRRAMNKIRVPHHLQPRQPPRNQHRPEAEKKRHIGKPDPPYRSGQRTWVPGEFYSLVWKRLPWRLVHSHPCFYVFNWSNRY